MPARWRRDDVSSPSHLNEASAGRQPGPRIAKHCETLSSMPHEPRHRRPVPRHSIALCLTIAATWSLSTGAGAAVDPLLTRLQARIDHLRSLKGRFVQSLDSKSLGRPRTEEGRFCLRKPSLMRWDYEKPEEKLAILDGRNSWLYV